jgi:polysaccharide export outer membrane protein
MRLALPLAALLVAGGLACGSLGTFVWVEAYAPTGSDSSEDFLIKPGDLLDVRVFNQDKMSGKARVRSDGKVTLPFLNDVTAAGYTPVALAQQLQTRLREFINAPVVTVSVEEGKSPPISVVGNVARPGQYSIETGAGVLHALAAAGGMTDFAHRDRIFVLRSHPEAVRIRFTYRGLVRGESRAGAFRLRGGDVLVVE